MAKTSDGQGVDDRTVTDAIVLELSRQDIDWKPLGRELGVPEAVIKEIEEDERERSREKKYLLLRKWKQSRGSPTIRELVIALDKLGRRDLIGTIRDVAAKDIETPTRILGTPEDAEEHRKKLDETQHHTNQLADDTNQMLRDLSTIPTFPDQSDAAARVTEGVIDKWVQRYTEPVPLEATADMRQQKLQKEQLTSELISDILNQCEGAQRVAPKAEMECVVRARGATESMSGIPDVNQVSKEVATIVHEQGEMIDSPVAHVESAEVRVTGYQGITRRKKKFRLICCIVCNICVLLIVVPFLAAILSDTEAYPEAPPSGSAPDSP